jgi:hypothetical protein
MVTSAPTDDVVRRLLELEERIAVLKTREFRSPTRRLRPADALLKRCNATSEFVFVRHGFPRPDNLSLLDELQGQFLDKS